MFTCSRQHNRQNCPCAGALIHFHVGVKPAIILTNLDGRCQGGHPSRDLARLVCRSLSAPRAINDIVPFEFDAETYAILFSIES